MRAALVVWACFCTLFCSDAGIEIRVFMAFVFGGLGVVGLWLIRLIIYAIWFRKRGLGASWRSWLVEPVLVGVVAAAVLTGGAFRLRFVVSWPFLAQYAHAVHGGDVRAAGRHHPTVVGLFVVRETEALPGGVVRMITTRCGFDDCGIAYSPAGTPPRIGEDIYTPLGGAWWRWWRSW